MQDLLAWHSHTCSQVYPDKLGQLYDADTSQAID